MNRPRPAASRPPRCCALEAHPFPGNVRELKNVIERALIASGGQDILPAHLHLPPAPAAATPPAAAATEPGARSPLEGIPFDLEQAELVLIRRALDQCAGNVAQAARLLGVPRMRIYRRLGSESAS